MRKVGYFFASFIPFLAAIGIEFIASFFLMGMGGLFLVFSEKGNLGIDTFNNLQNSTDFSYTLMIIFAILCIVIFSLWYYSCCGGCFLPKASEAFDGFQLLGVIAIIPGAQFACSFIMAGLAQLMPVWMEQYEKLLETSGLDDAITLPMFCYAVLLAPIGEELIFRGVTLRLARQSLPFWFANLFQAILFGAFHMNWIQGIYAFALGFLLGFVCEKGGSIYYSILLHMLFNFWGTIISPILSETDDSAAVGAIVLSTAVMSLVLGLFFFIFGISRRKKRQALPC